MSKKNSDSKSHKPATPKDHWEMHYSSKESRKARPESAFDPIQGKKRPTLYKKVNESDH